MSDNGGITFLKDGVNQDTTSEPPLNSTVSEPPLNNITSETPLNSTASEPHPDSPTSESPFNFTTSEPPVASNTSEPPLASNTLEPPLTSNTSERPSGIDACRSVNKAEGMSDNDHMTCLADAVNQDTTAEPLFDSSTVEQPINSSESPFDSTISEPPLDTTSEPHLVTTSEPHLVTTSEPPLDFITTVPPSIYDAIRIQSDDDLQQDEGSILDRLLLAGADPNCSYLSKPTPLYYAVSLDKCVAVEKLLKFGADPDNTCGDTEAPIISAACRNSHKIVDLLIHYKADVNAVDGLGYSPLHRASGFGHKETVDRLLQCDDINIDLRTSNHAASAGNLAAAANNVSVLRALVEHGCDVNTQDILYNRPLHYMAINGCVEVVGALLKAGAHPDPVNRAGATPLWNAVHKERVEVCRRLLLYEDVSLSIESTGVERGRGSRKHMVFYIYLTPVSLLWVAVERENTTLVHLLLEAGLNIHHESWIRDRFSTTENKDQRLEDFLLRAINTPLPLKRLCKLVVTKQYRRNLSELPASVKLPTVLRNCLLP